MSHQVAALANGLSLSGRVDYANASACQKDGEAIMAKLAAKSTWVCELSALETGNSVTAAVLMAWQRYAFTRGSTIALSQAPERLRAILAASNLDGMFALDRNLEGKEQP